MTHSWVTTCSWKTFPFVGSATVYLASSQLLDIRLFLASPTWWTWLWASSGNWWQTGKPGVLQSMVLQRVGHDWATELELELVCLWLCMLLPVLRWLSLWLNLWPHSPKYARESSVREYWLFIPTVNTLQEVLPFKLLLATCTFLFPHCRAFSSVQFSCSVVSDSLQSHGLQHARLPCPSPTPGAYCRA